MLVHRDTRGCHSFFFKIHIASLLYIYVLCATTNYYFNGSAPPYDVKCFLFFFLRILGKNTIIKFISEYPSVIAEMISAVALNPYKSVNLPPKSGPIIAPVA